VRSSVYTCIEGSARRMLPAWSCREQPLVEGLLNRVEHLCPAEAVGVGKVAANFRVVRVLHPVPARRHLDQRRDVRCTPGSVTIIPAKMPDQHRPAEKGCVQIESGTRRGG